ncbi:MAG: tetratricopeptide repeat protein [SAR324 cluster bacterium]|nr:tetratricopeptide repeat protein [SAR324 cluster bacterium]
MSTFYFFVNFWGNRILWGVLLMGLFGMISLSAAQDRSSVSLFVEANQAYEQQDFARSAALYESLLQKGHQNGHLHYNLGNAYYRLGNLGKAIGYYLRALNDLPRHEDLIANLNYVRLQTTDQKEDLEQSWRETFQEWSSPFTLQEWLLMLLICNGLFWAVAALRLFIQREIFSWLLYLSGGLTVFLLLAAFTKWWAPLPVGTILPQESAIYSAPHEQATVLFQLHEGTEVVIEEEAQEWAKVRFEPTKKGWIEKKNLFFVTLQTP